MDVAMVMRSGDRLWFEEIVLSLARPATKFANVLVHDFDLAEEIVQEAFREDVGSFTEHAVYGGRVSPLPLSDHRQPGQ